MPPDRESEQRRFHRLLEAQSPEQQPLVLQCGAKVFKKGPPPSRLSISDVPAPTISLPATRSEPELERAQLGGDEAAEAVVVQPQNSEVQQVAELRRNRAGEIVVVQPQNPEVQQVAELRRNGAA